MEAPGYGSFSRYTQVPYGYSVRSAFILTVLPRPLPGGHALEVWGELDDVAVAFRQSDADGPLQILIVASVVAPGEWD